MDNNFILSPVMLWRDFTVKYPLQESKTSEEVFDNVIYSDVYFSGRETEQGRVRIFGVYATSRGVKMAAKNACVLILPDASSSIDSSLVNYYVHQGYSVLMVDLRGEADGLDNFTHYPECVSYANYFRRGDKMDKCEGSATQTCWYEWVSVAKYALAYLRSQKNAETVGVIGIGIGADVGWQLCSTEENGVACFIPLFCAGGRAYKGYFKNGETDMPMNDECLRYLAGVDSSAYAQYMHVPTFFMTATNCAFSDVERATDSLNRVPKETPLSVNYAPCFNDVLDADCKKNVDLFLAKYLLGFRIQVPSEPKLSLTVDGGKLSVTVEESSEEQLKIKRVSIYAAEGGEDPSFRVWQECKHVAVSDNKQLVEKTISGACSFVSAFAVVNYRNGFTVSSRIVTKKFPAIAFPKVNLLYSGRNGLSSVAVYSLKNKSESGLFYLGERPVSLSTGVGGIVGVTSDAALAFYNFNSQVYRLREDAILKLDVLAEDHCAIRISVVTENLGEREEYSADFVVQRGGAWKNLLVPFSDFKAEYKRSVADFDAVRALTIRGDKGFIVNNILVI